MIEEFLSKCRRPLRLLHILRNDAVEEVAVDDGLAKVGVERWARFGKAGVQFNTSGCSAQIVTRKISWHFQYPKNQLWPTDCGQITKSNKVVLNIN